MITHNVKARDFVFFQGGKDWGRGILISQEPLDTPSEFENYLSSRGRGADVEVTVLLLKIFRNQFLFYSPEESNSRIIV